MTEFYTLFTGGVITPRAVSQTAVLRSAKLATAGATLRKFIFALAASNACSQLGYLGFGCFSPSAFVRETLETYVRRS